MKPLALRVHSVVEAGERFREIRLRGRVLATMRFSPGSHVVVHTPARRVYSVWVHRPDLEVVALRVAVHDGASPGCVWAAGVSPGDTVLIEPPRTKIALTDAAPYHLFAGEETGAVPLLALRAALHRSRPDATVLGVLETSGPAGEMHGHRGVPPLPWVHRGPAPAVASPVLLEAVRSLDLPAAPGVAYVAGESATCRLIQAHLVHDRGWPRACVKTQPQWAPGRPGFGAGRGSAGPEAS